MNELYLPYTMLHNEILEDEIFRQNIDKGSEWQIGIFDGNASNDGLVRVGNVAYDKYGHVLNNMVPVFVKKPIVTTPPAKSAPIISRPVE